MVSITAITLAFLVIFYALHMLVTVICGNMSLITDYLLQTDKIPLNANANSSPVTIVQSSLMLLRELDLLMKPKHFLWGLLW